MRIRMKAGLSGTRDGQDWPPRGGEIDLPDGEAAQMCAAGLAEPVPVDDVEHATPPPVETRPAKRGPGRPRKTPAKE